jgi:hypothetical protein
MKRKLFLLTSIILSFSLLLTACGQKDIGEAKAKEIGLAYINKMFDTSETEAEITLEKQECYRNASGAMVTSGDSEFSERWIYYVRVPLATTMTKYEALVIASTGEVIYAYQSNVNIRLTDAQKKQADELYLETAEWEEKHMDALQALTHACFDWAKEKFNDNHLILLDANNGVIPPVKIREFGRTYYVVTRDGKVYTVSMSWPSLELISIEVETGLLS